MKAKLDGDSIARLIWPMSLTGFADSLERERRFLVRYPSVVETSIAVEEITQAYVYSSDGFAIRVRRIQARTGSGELDVGRAWLTGKGPRVDEVRHEYDVEVAPDWASVIIANSAHVVAKRRHQVITDQTWEVDEFLGRNAGLWIAELEGGHEISWVAAPDWVGDETRNDRRYDNESLAMTPFQDW